MNDAASLIEPEDEGAGNVAGAKQKSPIGSGAWICRNGRIFGLSVVAATRLSG